jgi:hypothetical protein
MSPAVRAATFCARKKSPLRYLASLVDDHAWYPLGKGEKAVALELLVGLAPSAEAYRPIEGLVREEIVLEVLENVVVALGRHWDASESLGFVRGGRYRGRRHHWLRVSRVTLVLGCPWLRTDCRSKCACGPLIPAPLSVPYVCTHPSSLLLYLVWYGSVAGGVGWSERTV